MCCPQIDVRVSALSMVYDLLMRFGLHAFVNKDDSEGNEDHPDITALLDVELSARKRHLRDHTYLNDVCNILELFYTFSPFLSPRLKVVRLIWVGITSCL